MTHPHYIDRKAVAELIERLRENLFDSAPSRLVCVESADVQSALDTIQALSRPMEAVAWRWRWPDTNKWHYADYNLHPEADRVQALAVIPTEAEGKG